MDENQDSRGGSKRALTTVGVIVVIAVIAVGIMMFSKKKDASVATTTATASPKASTATDATTTTTASSSSTSSYKDGTYTKTGTYQTPGGTEKITVELTLKSGVVASSTVTSGAVNPQSVRYQEDFISGYKTFVDGKNIDDISISSVSGSSLSPNGFKDAVSQIKTAAKA